jgi:hypothetical protein
MTTRDEFLTATEKLKLVPPSQAYLGKSYGTWAADFWQYVFSIPAARNPLNDETGANAYEQNTGDVFFLSGSLERSSNKSFTRHITIPRGKAIFVPIACCEVSEAEAFGLPEQLLFEIGRRDIDQVTDMYLDTNGEKVLNKDLLQNYFRIESSLFELAIPPDGLAGLPHGRTRTISVGYFVLLRSLPGAQGGTTVKIYAKRRDFVIDVTYEINRPE